jgi:glucose-1-phosphate thymidylyltransferase
LEYQLTDALQAMIDAGAPVQAFKVKSWFDCGRKQSLLHTNCVLMERVPPPSPPEGSFHNTVIIPPVHIAPGCHITDSIIGPDVAIAEHAVIHSAIVQNSILGAYSTLERIILQNSVIGNDTTLRGRATSVNLGDNTEIDFDD